MIRADLSIKLGVGHIAKLSESKRGRQTHQVDQDLFRSVDIVLRPIGESVVSEAWKGSGKP